MPAWNNVKDDTQFGVVIANFKGDKERKLQLSIGDTVYIQKEAKGWYYGCNTRNENQLGIFPANYLLLKEASVAKYGSSKAVTPKEVSVVQEITAVLREWGQLWKELYVKTLQLHTRESNNFKWLERNMDELIDKRKMVLSRKLTMDEVKDMQQKITSIIDMGNAKLGLDLVVRDEMGNVLDPLHTSTIQLFRQHELAAQRIEEETGKELQGSKHQKTTSFHLLVSIRGFVCNVGDEADVLMALYDATEGHFISESYLAEYQEKGVPKDINMLNNMKVLFTDLGQKDLERSRIFIVCQIIRIGRMLQEEVNKKDKPKTSFRRPFGVAALDITEIIKSTMDKDKEQCLLPCMQCGNQENLDSLLKKMTSTKDNFQKGQGIYVDIKKINGELSWVQKDYQHLLGPSTQIVRKMGFPDVIMPADFRNDAYITLLQGEFKRTRTADRNIEVEVFVCNQVGTPIDNVIYQASNSQVTQSYQSVIYYHDDKPKWGETFKVVIPISDFYGCHLKFTFRHRSSNEVKDKAEKPFAMAYIRLMHDNGTVITDGVHELVVYKIDSKKAFDQPTYLKLPSQRKELDSKMAIQTGAAAPAQLPASMSIQSGPLSQGVQDSFSIHTLVCSTKLTHNVALMNLLKWRDNQTQLKPTLQNFRTVDGEEVVKFLNDILDTLFNIFMANKDSDEYDELVFHALIFLLGFVSDRKYSQFRSVLDVYISENFSATLAYSKLLNVLRTVLENADGTVDNKQMIKTMEAMLYIFKFIVRSRTLFASLNNNSGSQQFEVSMKHLLSTLVNVMAQNTEKSAPIQAACLCHLPSVFTETDILETFSRVELSNKIIEMMRQIQPHRLKKEKVQFMKDVVQSTLFTYTETRAILLPDMMQHVNNCLLAGDQMDLCVDILSNILNYFFGTRATFDDICFLTTNVLRTVLQTIINFLQESEGRPQRLPQLVAVLIGILRQMTEKHYKMYLQSLETDIDLQDFLEEILTAIKDLTENCVFPADWHDMMMMQNRVFFQALKHFATVLKERCFEPFHLRLWNTFFDCSITLLIQEPLQLEKFSPTKRQKITRRYDDMRRTIASEVKLMWYSLGHQKVKLLSSIVGPILRMTLIPESELRKETIPIFFDIMQCEFTSMISSRMPKGNFFQFEEQLIVQLDHFIGVEMKGDQQYKELFYTILRQSCEKHETMRELGVRFVETVSDLLQRLLNYRDVISADNREHKMTCIVALLNFYEDHNRQDLYIQYVHKLCDLHLASDNFTEAACTLMLYTQHLKWLNTELPEVLRSKKHPQCVTNQALKEAVYYDMIDYFDKGKVWEKGIDLCKELVQLYEGDTFNYTRLSQILRKQATFYDCIMTSVRPEPEYFRVGYWGKGFPSFLQNKEFVYRGKDYEKLTDFIGSLQNSFPNSTLLKGLDPTEAQRQSLTGQFLQVNAVEPVRELPSKFKRKQVDEQVLKYYKVNEVKKFTFRRKKDESSKEIGDLWLQRLNFTTTNVFPGILRWFLITSTEIEEISPLQNAIEALEEKNNSLLSLISQFEKNTQQILHNLSMVLNGIVDAAVNGGILGNFRKFYTDEYLLDNPSDKELVAKLKEATLIQLMITQVGLDIHKRRVTQDLMPLHDHMEKSYISMKDNIKKDYDIHLSDDARQRIAAMLNITVPVPARIPKLLSSQTIKVNPNRQQTIQVSNLSRSSSSMPTASTNREAPTKVFTRPSVSPRTSAVPEDAKSNRFSSSNTDMSRRNELSQELTPQRPLRPNKPGSRPGSGIFPHHGSQDLSHSSLDSLDSTSPSIGSRSQLGDNDNLALSLPPEVPEKEHPRERESVFATKSHIADEQPPLLPKKNGERMERSSTAVASPTPSIPPRTPTNPQYPPLPKKHQTNMKR